MSDGAISDEERLAIIRNTAKTCRTWDLESVKFLLGYIDKISGGPGAGVAYERMARQSETNRANRAQKKLDELREAAFAALGHLTYLSDSYVRLGRAIDASQQVVPVDAKSEAKP